MRRLGVVLALALAACGGSLASPSPSPSGSPAQLTVPQLKYRVIDAIGRPWFCDPDFFPVGRGDEEQRAQEKLPEIQRDAETLAAIVAYLKLSPAPPYTADQQLAIYREWKALNVLPLQPTAPGVWGFTYLAMKNVGGGERVEGRVLLNGSVSILIRQQAGPPPCPICLAMGTRIATPRGDVAVQDLRTGDPVWTLDTAGARIAAPLVAVSSAPAPATHEIVRLALDDGRVVFVSPGHPTADRRPVGDLQTGDALDDARVASTQRVTYGGGATYDILPAGATGTYWANGVLLGSTLRAQ